MCRRRSARTGRRRRHDVGAPEELELAAAVRRRTKIQQQMLRRAIGLASYRLKQIREARYSTLSSNPVPDFEGVVVVV
uniref:Uncharacterized protein n=1 Tax=Arundo donax TaxID=35708 RepID=A0A0A8ZRM9_ARUDO